MRRRWLPIALLGLGACDAPRATPPPRPAPVPSPLESAARAFRAHRNFDNLQRVAWQLEPGQPRADIEKLLGEPDGWDDPSVYYSARQRDDAGEPLGLTLDFYVWYTDGRPTTPSDRLERWRLGSGNRWESGTPEMPQAAPGASATPSAEATAAAAHYRERRDYASLKGLVPHAGRGVARADVEALLGPPSACEERGHLCHYLSERTNAAGLPVALIVDYRRPNARDGLAVTDRVQSLGLGPVAPVAR